MSAVVEELLVVLRGDASDYARTMGEGVRLLSTMDMTAANTAKRLEQVSEAWAKPQSTESFLKNEMELQRLAVEHQQDLEKQALREKLSRMEAEADAEYQKGEAMSRDEDERIAAQQNDMATFQSWRVAERQTELQQNTTLESQLFNLTHSGYERRLRDMNAYYTKQRQEHAGNAKALAQLDEIYFLEWRRLQETQEDAFRRNLLKRRGPMMMAARQLVPQLGFIAGGQLGMLGMQFSQGLGIGAAMAGVLGLSMAMKSIKSSLEELAEKEKLWAKEVKAAREEWEKIGKAVLDLTPWQKELTANFEKTADRVKEAFDQRDKSNGVSMYGAAGMGNYPMGEMFRADVQIEAAEEEAKIQSDIANERLQSELKIFGLKKQAGPLAERDLLEATLRRKEVDLVEESLQRIRQQKFAQEMGATYAGSNLEEQAKERMQLAGEIENRFAVFYASADEERRELTRRQNEKIFSEQAAAEDARIRLMFKGGDREIELLRARHRRELEAAERQGQSLKIIQTRQWYEMQALKQQTWDEANKSIQDALKGLQIETDLWLKKITEVEAGLKRLKLAHPEADEELLKKLNLAQRESDLRQWAKAETRLFHPEEVLQEYTNKLREAVSSGVMSEADAHKAWDQKWEELYGSSLRNTGLRNTGQWQSYRSQYIDVSGLAAKSTEALLEEIVTNTRPLRNLPPGLN